MRQQDLVRCGVPYESLCTRFGAVILRVSSCQRFLWFVQTTLPFGGNTVFSPIVIPRPICLLFSYMKQAVSQDRFADFQCRGIKRFRCYRVKSYCSVQRSRCLSKLVPLLCADALKLCIAVPCSFRGVLMSCRICTLSSIPLEHVFTPASLQLGRAAISYALVQRGGNGMTNTKCVQKLANKLQSTVHEIPVSTREFADDCLTRFHRDVSKDPEPRFCFADCVCIRVKHSIDIYFKLALLSAYSL